MKISTIKQFGLLFLLFISMSQMNASVNKSQGKANTSPVLNIADAAFRDMKYSIAADTSPVLNMANAAFRDMKYSIAADYYQYYLEDSTKVTKEILSKLSECYWQMHQFNKALEVYQKSFPAEKQGASITERHRIAELYARKEQYQKAAEWLQGVEGYESKASVYSNPSQLEKLKKDSLNWNLKFLNINTGYREFAPYLKEKILYFSSNKIPEKKIKSYGWDGQNYSRLWQIPFSEIDTMDYAVSIKEDQSKKSISSKTIRLADIYENSDTKTKLNQSAFNIKEPTLSAESVKFGTLVNGLNTLLYNAGTISIDKNNHIYFSANYEKPDKSGINRIRIMQGLISGNTITDIKPLLFGDANSYSVMHPSVNKDGKILVFSSDKPGGKGGFDLYYSLWNDTIKIWGSAQSFGDNINKEGNEVFPDISEKGNLYFSSDILPGLGGLDIYRIPLNDAMNGTGTPEHISYPVNSSGDDFGITLDSTENKGYFTSDRLNDDDNIYSFSYLQVKNGKIHIIIIGNVIQYPENRPLAESTVFLWNQNTDSVLIAKTDNNGHFEIPVPFPCSYIVKAVKKDYDKDCLQSTVNVLPELKDIFQSIPRDLKLKNLKIGLTIAINNIHYDFDKSFIRADAKPILDSLVTVLNTYPVIVELGSHTDCRGTNKYNDKLSQRRAEAAVNYLIQHGIDPSRITAKGYGETQLLNKCADGVPCSKVEHQANRRTEIKIIGFTTNALIPEFNPDKFENGQKTNLKDLPGNFFENCK